MSNDEINYFPDLKKFLNFILKNIYLLIILLAVTCSIGYFKYLNDIKNIDEISNYQLRIELNDKNNNYELKKDYYYFKSQVEPILEYIDVYKFTFNLINDELINYFENLNIKFEYSKHNYDHSNFIFQNHKISDDKITGLIDNIRIKFFKYVQQYKNNEYEKMQRKLSKYMHEILIAKDISLLNINKIILDEGNLNRLEAEEKIQLLREAYENFIENEGKNSQNIESWRNRTDFEDIFIDDFIYKSKFLNSVKRYFQKLCNNEIYKSDFFCKIHSDNLKSEIVVSKNLSSCNLSSDYFTFQQILLSIVDNKIECADYNFSKETVFKPLDVFLNDINFIEGLYKISFEKIESKINITLFIYLLYSLVIGIFIFLIISAIIQIYKNK